jgi:hypothetical protein
MESKFALWPNEATQQIASSYGVSVDNYTNSLGDLGITGFEVGQSGLLLVGRTYSGRQQSIGSSWLFEGVYDSAVASAPVDVQQAPKREYTFPDSVLDFAHKRNVEPISVVRMGSKLLSAAVTLKAGLGVDLPLHQPKAGGRIGKIDSRLCFAISPINTIVVERKPASRFGRR